MTRKIHIGNKRWGHLFPGHDADKVGDRKVFIREKAKDGALAQDRFLWFVDATPASRVTIRNARYGYLFGSDLRQNGDRTVWCRENPSAEDLGDDRFHWDLIQDGETFKLRNCKYGYVFAANEDMDGKVDHFAEISEAFSDEDKFRWSVDDWGFGPGTIGNSFAYWQVEFDAQGDWISEHAKRGFEALVDGGELARFTDVFVYIHGMGNDRTDARGIYNSYFKDMDSTAAKAGVDRSKMAVIGVIWPSGGLVEQITEGFAEIASKWPHVRGVAAIIDKVTGSKVQQALKEVGGAANQQGIVLARQSVGPLLNKITATPKAPRVHLIAHSMGTVVAGWALHSLDRPLDSAFLVQGALQSGIFDPPGSLAGTEHRVKRYIAATTSSHDQIFSKMTWIGAQRLATHGFTGVGARSLHIDEVTAPSLQGANFVNIDCSSVIKDHDGYKKEAIASAHWVLSGCGRG